MSVLVEDLFRESAGRITARLVRRFGAEHLDLAEDAVQDAIVRALETWPYRGVPDNPGGWLMRVAERRALDRLRTDRHRERLLQVAQGVATRDGPHLEDTNTPTDGADSSAPGGDEVRLLLLCCHPALSERARVALTLKLVAGFGVHEIARAFLAAPEAVAQQLVRAKRTLRSVDAPLVLGAAPERQERRDSALEALYLMFNEGYAPTGGDRAVREDLCIAAIRLTTLLAEDPGIAAPPVHALQALMLLQASRLRARVDGAGDLVLLDDQDRGSWDIGMIGEGLRALDRAATGPEWTTYHVEAAVAAVHATAASPGTTDWPRLLTLYDQLVLLKPTPIVRLNRAVVLGRVRGPEVALAALADVERHPAMRRYSLLPAAVAHFSAELGDIPGARDALSRAVALAGTEAERRLLERRRARLAT